MALDSVRNARVALTGASGFLGSRVARRLVELGARVHAYGRRPSHPIEGAEYTSWDITEGPLRGAPEVDAVIHCAGAVTDWGPRDLFVQCHEVGTRNVLASFDAPIVHVSTASVYDPYREKRFVREDATLPRRYLNAYSETKAEAERIIATRSRHVILRPHAIYGPGDHVLLPRILEAYRFGRLIAVGDGSNRISLTHVDNLVDACVLALGRSLADATTGVFNVADDAPVVLHDALTAVLRATGRNPRVNYLPKRVGYAVGAVLERAYELAEREKPPRLTRYRVAQLASEYVLDITRAKDVLGYRPERTFAAFVASGELGS